MKSFICVLALGLLFALCVSVEAQCPGSVCPLQVAPRPKAPVPRPQYSVLVQRAQSSTCRCGNSCPCKPASQGQWVLYRQGNHCWYQWVPSK